MHYLARATDFVSQIRVNVTLLELKRHNFKITSRFYSDLAA
jgi:hypothetical protein